SCNSLAARAAICSRVQAIMGSCCSSLVQYARAGSCRRTRAGVAELDPLLANADLDDALHKDTGRVNVVRIELAGGNEMLDLGHCDPGVGVHHRIEIARGLAVNQVAGGISLPGMDDGEVGKQ